ncbi:DUF1501 domain-containing protein [Chitinophagales bacterium]|nr:DUF1501 domain-containing protein [Chitinophagales bacterium]
MCNNHNNTKKNARHGSALEHGDAHEKDHLNWSRRDFLANAGLVGMGSMFLGKSLNSAIAPSPLLAGLNNSESDRVLVMIRLEGGNDGLNTTIMRGNSDYYNLRPNIAIQESGLFGLSTEVGMPNSMLDIQSHWQNNEMAVIHSVGYPDQNYSHFRSSDIWASASDSEVVDTSGWMGRFLDRSYPAFLTTPPEIPPALQIGVQSNQVFFGPQTAMGLAVSNPQEFYQLAATGQLYSTANLTNCPHDEELGFLRQVANNAFRYSGSIQDAYNNSTNGAIYQGDNYLAEQLAIVARMIKGQLGTRVYMVTIGGFDTHADQPVAHATLLNNLSSAVNSFFADLAISGDDQRTVAMTFSEFGRTAHENGSFGTDHAAAAPMMLFGPQVGGGFYGTMPDLTNIVYGDYQFTTDFRSVYATLLQDWLCIAPELVDYTMGQGFSRISGLVEPCGPPAGLSDSAALLGHHPDPDSSTSVLIKYAVKNRGDLRLQLLNKAGQPIRTLFAGYRERGSYSYPFNRTQFNIAPGSYIYRIDIGGKRYQRGIVLN